MNLAQGQIMEGFTREQAKKDNEIKKVRRGEQRLLSASADALAAARRPQGHRGQAEPRARWSMKRMPRRH
jgi:hypothetical protein